MLSSIALVQAVAQDLVFTSNFEAGGLCDWTATMPAGNIADCLMTLSLAGGVVLELVAIPAGTFQMGSPPDERGRATWEDLHQVTLTTPYYIGKYEVTQEQWTAVMGAPMPSDCGVFGAGDRYPAHCVSWDDIAGPGGFLDQLNSYLASTSQPVGFRLPTEAEWERAARAGGWTEFSFDVSGNPLWDMYCGSFPEAESFMWWCGNSSPFGSKEVGSKLANGYGLYDMHGNVWEWVADWWQVHLGTDPQVDPTGPATGSARISRGGCSWGGDAMSCRSAFRDNRVPDSRIAAAGFRIAWSE